MRETFIQQCLEILKREDFRRELKLLFSPVIDLIIQEIYPFIYLALLFVVISFLLILGIFVLLMRNKTTLAS